MATTRDERQERQREVAARLSAVGAGLSRWGEKRVWIRHRLQLLEARLETEPTLGFRARLYELQDEYREALEGIDRRCDVLGAEEGRLLEELADLSEGSP